MSDKPWMYGQTDMGIVGNKAPFLF